MLTSDLYSSSFILSFPIGQKQTRWLSQWTHWNVVRIFCSGCPLISRLSRRLWFFPSMMTETFVCGSRTAFECPTESCWVKPRRLAGGRILVSWWPWAWTASTLDSSPLWSGVSATATSPSSSTPTAGRTSTRNEEGECIFTNGGRNDIHIKGQNKPELNKKQILHTRTRCFVLTSGPLRVIIKRSLVWMPTNSITMSIIEQGKIPSQSHWKNWYFIIIK